MRDEDYDPTCAGTTETPSMRDVVRGLLATLAFYCAVGLAYIWYAAVTP